MKNFSFGMCVPLLVTGIFMGADVVLSAYFFRVPGHLLISSALLGMTLQLVFKVMKLTWRIRRHEFYSHMMVIPFFPWLWLAGIKQAELITTEMSSVRLPVSGLVGATAMVSIAFTLFQVWRVHATVVKIPVPAGRPEPRGVENNETEDR
ncbi:hypothetical protein C7431_11192 [Pantoea allii]|uniref:Uncharacterized protein n=1 Tax=Pantoea allii TaxID=574096 RepID=A0A2V2BC53_9GAMM|nr:hypothetical protein [Pantoea allii]PWK94355.1 hypothetical protein C7431_11192 [Pantoea allii]